MNIPPKRIEGRYSNYFLKRLSAATLSFRIPHSDFRIRQMQFHTSGAAGQKNGQSNRKRNFWGSVPKSAAVGFRISQ